MTCVLLLGWSVGGIVCGALADRIGRRRTLLLTVSLYAVGTSLCALSPNISVLLAFRFLAGLGIGGEWAAGASMVAEVVPENRRVEAGALLYTAAPFGLFLGIMANKLIAGTVFQNDPYHSWRYVMLSGILPAMFALFVRRGIREPVRWQETASAAGRPRISDLFTPDMLRYTMSGLLMALTGLLTWWSCNAFITVLATQLAQLTAQAAGMPKVLTQHLIENWKTYANTCFNWGGLIGTLLTIPIAKYAGRRAMYGLYFALASLAFFITFGLNWAPHTRLGLLFFDGLTIFGIFGSFTFYLPELFPTRLRATGSGFCYNVGRIAAAGGALVVGLVAAHGPTGIVHTLFWVGCVPLVGICCLPWIVETKGKTLPV